MDIVNTVQILDKAVYECMYVCMYVGMVWFVCLMAYQPL